MDERDVRLLKAIADLETGSPDALHEETDIPVSTIHYRLKNLREAGVIENDVYDVDPEAVGLPVTVIVEVYADYSGTSEDVAEKITDIEGVTQLFFTMGENDFAVIARLSGPDMVERLLGDFERIDEVDRTNSTYVVTPYRETNNPLQSYDLDTLLDELVDE